MPDVILVDEADKPLGTLDKMEAHRTGQLHRAFSIFIFNAEGDMLLQQRADDKYHSGGLWTNACCSHPLPGEAVANAASRRLQEELGFTTALQPAFSFIYKADFDNGLVEHEFDHVFTGRYNDAIHADPQEVKAIAFLPLAEIRRQLRDNADQYTAWFKIAFPALENYLAVSR